MTETIALIIAALCLLGYAREYRRRIKAEAIAPKRDKLGWWSKREANEAA